MLRETSPCETSPSSLMFFDARLRRLESNRADAFARWHFPSGDAAGKVNQFHL
jgi:hypothetical protein